MSEITQPRVPERRNIIPTVPSAAMFPAERRQTGALSVTIQKLEEALGMLPPDDPIHAQVQPYLDQASRLLGLTDREGVANAVSTLDETRRLSKILENFDQAIRLQEDFIVTLTDLKPIDLSTRRDRTYDAARLRSQFFELLRREQELTAALKKTWLFGKGDLQRRLALVQQDISRQRARFPELAQARLDDLAQSTIRQQEIEYLQTERRPADVKKVIALQKADASLTLAGRENATVGRQTEIELHRADAKRHYDTLQKLLTQKPGKDLPLEQWYRACNNEEGYLQVYSQLGPTEQLQTAYYWAQKLAAMQPIKPLLFGRSEWQRHYQRAQQERSIHLQLASQRSIELNRAKAQSSE